MPTSKPKKFEEGAFYVRVRQSLLALFVREFTPDAHTWIVGQTSQASTRLENGMRLTVKGGWG